MPAIFFTEASTLDALRREFVEDLEARAAAAAKTKAEAAAARLREAAEYWGKVHLGHPLKGGQQSQQVSAPATPGKPG